MAASVAVWLAAAPKTAFPEEDLKTGPGTQATDLSEEDPQGPALTDLPKLQIKGFSDVGFIASSDDENSNTFTLGSVDFFVTSDVSDKVSFLTEIVFEFETDENEAVFDLERVTLTYSLSDAFKIRMGRMHTPLGYWNQAYHHGAWFQTTVFRPVVYLFEDDGGILPIHSVGVELFGVKAFESLELEYHLGVLDGRGKAPDEVQIVRDNNDSKAVNVLLSVAPRFMEELRAGVHLYLDRIPPDPDDPARAETLEERIIGGHVIYIHDPVELLSELFEIRHDDRSSDQKFNTAGYYLQAGYRINKLTPYYRFDSLNTEAGDPFFASQTSDVRKHTFGLRWDLFTWNAFKLEYSLTDRKDQDDEGSVMINSSFVF